MALIDKLTAIANAIRGKTGKSGNLTLDQMVTEITGIQTNPTLQAKTTSPTTAVQTIEPDSGYDGLSKVTVNAMPTATQASPVLSVSSAGLITATVEHKAGYVDAGTKTATYQLSTQAAKTVTPGTSNQTAVGSGKYTTGAITVNGDSNLKAANIAKGVSIFGVTGSFEGGSKVVGGQFIPTQYSDTSIQDHPVTISGLGFKPTRVIVYAIGKYTVGNATHTGTSNSSGLVMRDTAGHYLVNYCEEEYDEYEDEYYEYWYLGDPMDSETPSITLNSDGFTIKATSYGTYNEIMWLPLAYRYIAFG